MVKTYWGVDSPVSVTSDLYNSVLKRFGKPFFWGRYLKTVQGSSAGLTKTEIDFIRNRGTKLLPIYNNFTSAIGFRGGMTSAVDAVSSARRLGIPLGVPIFANVEHSPEVDSSWLRGWYEGIHSKGYTAGYYHDLSAGSFKNSYCEAAKENENIHSDTILWSAEASSRPSGERNAPNFNPRIPSCAANVWNWKYGGDSETGAIDTNLATKELFDKLW
ncbi:MAG: glycoside hydrolase domain-containing protein [Bacillota bacterium]